MNMNMRKIAAIGCGCALALTLAGCSGGEAETTEETAPADIEEIAEVQKDFDGSGYSDTGAGTMWLSTPAGTTEDGNIPEIVADASMVKQIGFNTADMDGSVCTVYVDGMENMKTNAAVYMTQENITLEGEALAPGIHTVELVCMDGDDPTIYKAAKYKVVE